MPKIVDHEKIKEAIIYGAIQDVAINGLRNCTTKSVAKLSGYNEAYIYKYFKNLDDLLLKAFIQTDDDSYGVIRDTFYEVKKELHTTNEDFEVIARRGFEKCWDYFLYGDGEEYGIFYFRYYYSSFFQKVGITHHKELIDRMADAIEGLFKTRDEALTLVNIIFISVISYAMLIYSGELKDNKETRDMIFKSFHLTGMSAFDPEKIKIALSKI